MFSERLFLVVNQEIYIQLFVTRTHPVSYTHLDVYKRQDVTKEGDVVKLREKNLWKEFEGYLSSKGKLKLFRSEAVRVGFSRLWKEKNYKAIVDIGNRLPEQTIQEDANLLMYYDISLGRI